MKSLERSLARLAALPDGAQILPGHSVLAKRQIFANLLLDWVMIAIRYLYFIVNIFWDPLRFSELLSISIEEKVAEQKTTEFN